MAAKSHNMLLEGPIGAALMRLTVPIVAGNLLQTGYQLTDAFWVGRLSASSVAAVTVSFPVTFLVIALGSGLAMAGAVLIAQYAGAGRQDMVDHVAGQTMMMVLLTSILLGAAGYLLAPQILTALDVAGDVRAGALDFMRVSFAGIVFIFCYTMFQALLRGVGQTGLPLLIMLATVLLNFILDPLFIFGWGPIPASGVVGAAIATLITQALASVVGIAILLRGKHGIHLKLKNLRPDMAYIRRASLLGFPGSIDLSTRALGLMAMSFLVVRFGTLPTAAYGVGSTIMQIVTIPAAGLSMALTTLVGQNLGAGNTERADKIARLGILYGFAALSLFGIVAFAAAPAMIAFFVPSDRQVIGGGSDLLRIMALTWGGIGVQYCIVAVLRASGRMGHALAIALVSQWVIQFPLAYFLSVRWGLGAEGIWWSFPASNVATALLAIAWYRRGSWKHGHLVLDPHPQADAAAPTRIPELRD